MENQDEENLEEAELENEFVQDKDSDICDLLANREACRRAAEKFLYKIIDEIALGVMFDAHRKHNTDVFDLDQDTSSCETESVPLHLDIFGNYNMKKTQECVCPSCERSVAAQRFAPHLEKCMGLGRKSSRNARRLASNKERENTSYSGMGSDNEDDADWNSGEKRNRRKKDRNGNRKGKGTPKKMNEIAESADAIDIEGEEEDIVPLRDMLDYSNGSSPSDSSTSSKRREKPKSKKSKRDRASPAVTILNTD